MESKYVSQFDLTRDEVSILRCLIKGISVDAICSILKISENQYQEFITSILQKTGMDNLLELGMWVVENINETASQDSHDSVWSSRSVS